MKVKDLKQKLEKLDDDMDIHIENDKEFEDYSPIGDVKILIGLQSGQTFYYIEPKYN